MGSADNFCLRWNDFESNISSSFKELRQDREFFDVTLCCDEGTAQLQAHKVILAACSPFFRRILSRNPHQNPLIYLKGVDYANLAAVLNFMYHGEVNVSQDELNAFLRVAEDLAVKGLTDSSKSNGSSAAASTPIESRGKQAPSLKRPPPLTPAVSRAAAPPPPQSLPSTSAVAKKRKSEPSVKAASSSSVVDSVEVKPDLEALDVSNSASATGSAEGFDDSSVAEDMDDEYGYGQFGEGSDYLGADNSNQDEPGVLDGTDEDGSKVLLPPGVDEYIVRDPAGTYWCQACSHKAPRKQDLVRHVERKHHTQGYACQYCRSQFRARDQMLRHIRATHASSSSSAWL